MVPPPSEPPKCPRCGSNTASLCGQSVQYGPAATPDQPLQERELHTLAYQCDCGMAFTQTVKGEERPDSRNRS
jgi:hypothetical protein